MKRWVGALISVVIVGVGTVLAPSSAGAGGWAVSTVDPMTAPVAGATTAVGFTIRQHGVRRINPEGKVGISIESAAGVAGFFPATPRGATGHFVARVRFPEPGAYRWTISQGWFAVQDLGRIDVAAASAIKLVGSGGDHGDVGSTYRGSLSMRLLLPALGIGLGALAVAEVFRSRRRRSRGLIAT